MSGLAWKVNRLRRMSVGEVLHRGRQWFSQRIEQRRVESGWQPIPASSVGSRRTLFANLDVCSLRLIDSLSGQEEQCLSRAIKGTLNLFGAVDVELGTPIDWLTEPTTGVKSPLTFGKVLDYRNAALVGNVKVIWELGRHHHLVPLAVAYVKTGDKLYRDAVLAQIESWVRQNPFGLGIHWCSSLELSLRLIAWSVVHSLFVLRDGTEGLFAGSSASEQIGRAIYQQAWFVRGHLSRHSSANNHLIGELVGLWVACRVFDMGRDGQKWEAQAKSELETEFRLQVFGDGVDREQAMYYHLWVLEYGLYCYAVGIATQSQFSAAFAERLSAMADFLRDVTPPGGDVPAIGDADDGFVTRFSACWPTDPYGDVLGVEQVLLKGSRPSRVSTKVYWYAAMCGRIPTLQEEAQTLPLRPYPRVYSEGGYAVLGDDNAHIVMDAGSLGYLSIAAHGHADALSFVMAVGGHWMLIDPGTYCYHDQPQWRNYFRGTSAHNTATVEQRDQSEIGGAFMWLTQANVRLDGCGVLDGGIQWVKGHHDGYSKLGIIHSRTLRYEKSSSRVVILDSFTGSGSRRVELWFHAATGTAVSAIGPNSCQLKRELDGVVLNLTLDPGFEATVFEGSVNPIAGWYSASLGSKTPSPSLRFACARVQLPKTISTTIEILY